MRTAIPKYDLQVPPGKCVYMASDFHLGAKNTRSEFREKEIVAWLDNIKTDAHTLFLLGDIFDFWFEYNKVVPKGFIRFQGKLAELADLGVQIILFHGNHDMWMFDYFKKELNAIVYKNPVSYNINGLNIHMGHGDGLGPGENGYKILRSIFRNPICIALFKILPPQIGLGIAHTWSGRSRLANIKKGEEFKGEEKEFLLQYSKDIEALEHHDFYIFGHRHLILDLPVSENARYLNLGEWVTESHYLKIDGNNLQQLKFKNN